MTDKKNEPHATAVAAKEAAAKGAEKKVGDGESTAKSPVSTTDQPPVFRTDMGESLPPQKPSGVE